MTGLRFVFLVATFALLVPGVSVGQAPDDPNEGSVLEWDGANAIWRFKWWGHEGRTYFIQHSENLLDPWQWVPLVESGNGSIREWGFTTTGDKFFLRLKYSDLPAADPATADFDGDGVSNLAELLQGTDPLQSFDSDGDGLPDDWEVHFGLNPSAGGDQTGNLDGDQFTNGEEFLARLDPTDPLNGQPSVLFPPTAPIGLLAEKNGNGTEAVVTWSDESDNELLFFIERSDNGGPWHRIGTVPANTTSYTDRNLAPLGVYYYRIASRNNVPE